MPAGYSDYYARHKIWPLSSNFVYQSDPNAINNYLSNCFNNATIWYNNNMTANDPYIECTAMESANCCDSVASNLWTWNDHPCFGGATGVCQKFSNPPL
uniref:Uncharacterized protein n=1 Tax=Acrobeloides nanus TaxID=290746 RepID=A0A914BZS2_9BILA